MKFKIKVKSPAAGLSRLKRLLYGTPLYSSPSPINCNLCNCCRCDEDVLTNCCPDAFIPVTLCATISNKTGSCDCLPDTFYMTYSTMNNRWEGIVANCGVDKIFTLTCVTSDFILDVNCPSAVVSDAQFGCNPFIFCAHVEEGASDCPKCVSFPDVWYLDVEDFTGEICDIFNGSWSLQHEEACSWRQWIGDIENPDGYILLFYGDETDTWFLQFTYYSGGVPSGSHLYSVAGSEWNCCNSNTLSQLEPAEFCDTSPESVTVSGTCTSFCCNGGYDITIAYACNILSNDCCGCTNELPETFSFDFVTNCVTLGTLTTTLTYTTSANCPIVTQTAPSAVGWEGTIDLADYDNNHGAAIYFELYCDNGVWKMYYAMQADTEAAGFNVAGGISGESTCFKFSYDVDGNPAATLIPMWNGTEYVCLGLSGGFTVDYTDVEFCCNYVYSCGCLIPKELVVNITPIENADCFTPFSFPVSWLSGTSWAGVSEPFGTCDDRITVVINCTDNMLYFSTILLNCGFALGVGGYEFQCNPFHIGQTFMIIDCGGFVGESRFRVDITGF